MAYRTIQPPFPLHFREMSKKNLEAYKAWFHQVIPERLAELTLAVKSTPEYEHWDPDFTPDSLGLLGRWFEGQVQTRKKTLQEIEEIYSKLTFPIDIPEDELTNATFSLAMDIGLYFSQVILTNLPGTRWDQLLRGKRDADYGQPVIVGFGPVILNPVRIGITEAYSISRHKPSRLRELYGVWAKMAK